MGSIIPYIGGKSFQAPWIISHFPPGYEGMGYLEPFAGSLAVFFAKRPSRVEVINDLDEDVYTLWTIIQKEGKRLASKAAELPYSRKLYEEWAREWWQEKKRPEDPFERALRFFFLMRSNRSGNLRYAGWCSGIEVNHASAYRSAIKEIEYAQRRLENVQIECRDFREVIERYDSENCVMYIDPPYLSVNHYNVKFSKQDHEDLAELLNKAKAKVLLSYYFSPRLREMYPEDKWIFFRRTFTKKAPNDPSDRGNGNEVLITNFYPTQIELPLA